MHDVWKAREDAIALSNHDPLESMRRHGFPLEHWVNLQHLLADELLQLLFSHTTKTFFAGTQWWLIGLKTEYGIC